MTQNDALLALIADLYQQLAVANARAAEAERKLAEQQPD